jgi:hypothetical protein
MLNRGVRMFLRSSARRLAVYGASVFVLVATAAIAEDPPQSGPAKDGSPAWYIYQPPARQPNRPQFTPPAVQPIAGCSTEAAKFNAAGPDERNILMANWKHVSPACQNALTALLPNSTSVDRSDIPTCVRSVICGPTNGQGINWRTNPSGLHGGVGGWQRVLWKSEPLNMGYAISYPYTLPAGARGAVSVGFDSHDNLWVLQRAPEGVPALSKFGPDHKLLFSLGDDVLGHLNKAHGMNVDAQDNAWIADPNSSIVMEISPEGKVLKTIGVRGKRGDWDEAKGQRLLWQPISISFGPNGDIYIGEGHANESPNDTQSGEPENLSGAARVLHLDKNGNFVSQLYGNMTGAGKFSQVHDLAIDPKNGDLWIADREQYRLVVYTNAGDFIKTIQTRNLMCNIAFDKNGDLWVATGGDGQFLKMNRDGKVLGAIGNGPGNGDGQTGETGYIRWDSKGDLVTGSTTQARVTVFTPPRSQRSAR